MATERDNVDGADDNLTTEHVFSKTEVHSWRNQITIRAIATSLFLSVVFSFIVCKLSLWIEWKMISNYLLSELEISSPMFPFHPDKALVWCQSEEEVKKLTYKDKMYINDLYTIGTARWCSEDWSATRKLSFTGGWVEIHDLPLNWWCKDVFEVIDVECGGLLQVSDRTCKMRQIFSARIKVAGRMSGFIPSEIDMSIGDEHATIKIKSLTRLNFNRKRRFDPKACYCEFDRSFIKLFRHQNGRINYDRMFNEREDDDNPTQLGGDNSSMITREDQPLMPSRILQNRDSRAITAPPNSIPIMRMDSIPRETHEGPGSSNV